MPSPQRVRWAEFRVIVVASVSLMILLTLIYLLSGTTLLRAQAELYVYVPDATGLDIGSPVEVNGIVVGHVKGVQLTSSNVAGREVKVTLDVLKDHLSTIPDDSYAQIDTESLVGDKLIEITSRTSPTSIRPGAELQFKPQSDIMERLDLSQFAAQLRSVDAMLTEIEQGQTVLGQFILGDEMYSTLLRRVGDIESAVHAAASTTSDVGSVLYTDRLYQQIREPIVQLDQALAKLQSGQGALGQALHDPADFASALNDIQSLRKSIANLRGADWMTSDESYASWNRTVAGWIQNVDQMNSSPLFNTSEMYDSLAGAAREMQDSLRDFRENPRKYLRLKVF